MVGQRQASPSNKRKSAQPDIGTKKKAKPVTSAKDEMNAIGVQPSEFSIGTFGNELDYDDLDGSDSEDDDDDEGVYVDSIDDDGSSYSSKPMPELDTNALNRRSH